nr:gliding motility-associated C-terminal domain-containing protein [uncultured Allomuricauda sp.]
MQARLKSTSLTPCAAIGHGRILFILFLFLGLGAGFAQSITIEDVSGPEDGGFIILTATLNGNVGGSFSVNVNTLDGTATIADNDYTPVGQTLNFDGTPGEPKTFNVFLTGDTTIEGDETLTIFMDNVSDGSVNIDDEATVTINNDDQANISIDSPVSVNEGDAGDGASTINFTVSIDQADPNNDITVEYLISGGNENGTTDVLTFLAGTTTLTQTIPVTTTGDDVIEADVPVSVTLSNASANANITTAVGNSSFIDNDNANISVDSPVSVNEGDAGDGASTINFTVSIDQSDPNNPITVDYAISGGNEDTDTGTLTFPTGTTTLAQTVAVTTTGDDDIEPDEAVSVTLNNASANATLGTAVGNSSFIDDDKANISVDSPVSVNEGDAGDGASTINFTVSIDQADPVDPITVSYTISGGNENGTTDVLTFLAGTTTLTQTIPVTTTGDDVVEADVPVSVTLSSPSANANITTAVGNSSFIDDDAPPVGYSVQINQDLITTLNQENVSFEYAGVPPFSTYDYVFASDGDGFITEVTGTGNITLINPTVSGIDLSSLPDGEIRLFFSITNMFGNQGNDASAFSDKNTTVPSGYTVSMDQASINFDNADDVSFTFTGAEIGETYNYTFSSTGGGANVTGTGTISTIADQITGIDLSGLGDGTIALNVTLSNDNGTGVAATDTVNKDTTVCGFAPTLDTSEPTVFCEIISVDLNDYVTSTTGPPGTVLVWSGNPSPENEDDHIDNNIEDGSGVYYGFFYNSANSCYSPSLELELERNFTPVITETTATEICGEGTSTLTVTATVEDLSAITYSWFDTLDANALPIASGTTFETGVLTEATSFYVSAASNECASERTEVVVSINNEPLAGVPIDGLTACNISSDEGPNTFDLDEGLIGQDPGTWEIVTDPSNGMVVIGTENIVDFTDLVSGDYVFEYITSTVGTCTETASAQITITVQDCISNEAIDLAVTKTFDGSGSYLLGDEIEFTITLQNEDGNTVKDIVITEILDANFELIDATPSLGSYDADSGQWTIERLEATDTEATLTIRVRPTEARKISNTATLISSLPLDDIAENNSSTVTVTVSRSLCVDPGTICNIFSPNNDNNNDTLRFIDPEEEFENNRLEIFDRYGNSVFQMDRYDNSWEGTGKNGDLPNGTYFYILDLDTTDNSDEDVVKGWIQLVR